MKYKYLNQYLIEQKKNDDTLSSELLLLIESILDSCVEISNIIGKGALKNMLGEANNINVQGERQKKLDIVCNEILLNGSSWNGTLAAIASEELQSIYEIPSKYETGNYLLLFDPLDGSSNIEVNATIGTIFSILRVPSSDLNITEKDFFQKGLNQVAAGYVVYGPQSILVLTLGKGVASFTLDKEIGFWKLINNDIKIPIVTQEYAINTSNFRHWFPPVKKYIEELQEGKSGLRKKNFNMRWVASMVADVHRILMRGGIFIYPADNRDLSVPGKLRLLYEANPMSFIIEQAGGAATDGVSRILEIVPEKLHQRVPVFLGSKEEVDLVSSYHKK